MRKFLILALLVLISACQSESRKNASSRREIHLVTPSGKEIRTTLAITPAEQEQGLSGVQPGDFSDDQGMLFFYTDDGERYFWMPDTYFDLDLFYLDKDLKVLDVVRKLPHHKGRANPDLIPKARPVWSRHVLEMKATSPLAATLKVGDRLKWVGSPELKDLEKKLP